MAVSNEQKMLKERIRAVLGVRRKTASDLGETDNEKKVYQRQILNDSNVTVETLTKILYMFHDIDANWLILGEGSMYKADHVAPRVYTQNNNVHDNKAGGDITVGSRTQVLPSQQKFEDLQARISELERDKRTLQAVVDAMTTGIKK